MSGFQHRLPELGLLGGRSVIPDTGKTVVRQLQIRACLD